MSRPYFRLRYRYNYNAGKSLHSAANRWRAIIRTEIFVGPESKWLVARSVSEWHDLVYGPWYNCAVTLCIYKTLLLLSFAIAPPADVHCMCTRIVKCSWTVSFVLSFAVHDVHVFYTVWLYGQRGKQFACNYRPT